MQTWATPQLLSQNPHANVTSADSGSHGRWDGAPLGWSTPQRSSGAWKMVLQSSTNRDLSPHPVTCSPKYLREVRIHSCHWARPCQGPGQLGSPFLDLSTGEGEVPAHISQKNAVPGLRGCWAHKEGLGELFLLVCFSEGPSCALGGSMTRLSRGLGRRVPGRAWGT